MTLGKPPDSDPPVRSKRAKPPSTSPAQSTAAPKPDAAFDLWLERGLHRLFDDIAQEPLPPALLSIIEQDRLKK